MSHHLLTIPAPGGSWLRANGGHGNRYARAELIKTWRQASAWEARRQHLPRIMRPVAITATIHLDTKPAHWDVSNWFPTVKAAIDGLVLHPKNPSADVLRGDCNCWVIGPDLRAGGQWADATLVLTFTELEDAS